MIGNCATFSVCVCIENVSVNKKYLKVTCLCVTLNFKHIDMNNIIIYKMNTQEKNIPRNCRQIGFAKL